MALEPVKVPQNVQIEDRLIGPITLRQVIICLIGGGISFVIWNIMKQSGLISTFHLLVAWIPFVIAAAFAFVKVQNLSLLRILLLIVERTEKPSMRVWQPRAGIRINVRSYFQTQQSTNEQESTEPVGKDKLQQLSSLLDESAHKYDPDVSPNPNVRPDTPEFNGPPKPVDPSRVSVDTTATNTPLDGITQRNEPAKTQPSSPMRDLSPPHPA
ncbi:hypothetical protein COU80_03015 [Candidatus Peregrinibacteria bacterium CG10_big_fil_rev_8_21_14_0_10_55_24]|nr:MAG: hypothetical protein COU80_03015 [Candidatus Peregrinibacteria bacterium CG10_big_fil_rev_8_21_14_0_10_55_24]